MTAEAEAEAVEEVDVAERVEVTRVVGVAVEKEEAVGSLKLVAVQTLRRLGPPQN